MIGLFENFKNINIQKFTYEISVMYKIFHNFVARFYMYMYNK